MRLAGINKIRSKGADGTMVERHYAWRGRGAPCFWRSDFGVSKGSQRYIAALAVARASENPARGKFREVLQAYLASSDFTRRANRTQADIKRSIFHASQGIDTIFGDAPIGAFNDPRIRRRALKWRDQTGGKVGDDRLRHLQRIIGFGVDRSLLLHHHLQRIRALYKSSRAEIIWTEAEIGTFVAGGRRRMSGAY